MSNFTRFLYFVPNILARIVDEDLNELAFSELIQFLAEHSLSLVIQNAKDNGREAFKVLRHFCSTSSKARVISLYNQLTTLTKCDLETVN